MEERLLKTRIWVVCFENPYEIGLHSKQLLCKAKSLMIEDDIKVSAICIGDYVADDLRSLSEYGADEIIYSNETCVDYKQIVSILMEMFKNESQKPRLIIFPANEWGKCIAADLAVRIDAGLTAECIDIETHKERNEYKFIFTRAAINSTVLAQIQCINTQVCMCTCKENVFTVSNKYPKNNIPVRECKSKILSDSIQLNILKTEHIFIEEKNLTLENAKLVFGIGRGIRDREGLNLITQVAQKYNAAIAGTRAIIEEGFIEKTCQVGQSGISISPEIYVAIGISGATQHIVGIKNAKIIIAINTDERAPIFSYANYCIIEDYKNIFKELI